jgi:hypothetical protein
MATIETCAEQNAPKFERNIFNNTEVLRPYKPHQVHRLRDMNNMQSSLIRFRNNFASKQKLLLLVPFLLHAPRYETCLIRCVGQGGVRLQPSV